MLQVASDEGRLPGGEYLIGLRPGGAGQSFAALQADLDQLLARIRP
jgi:RNase P protein component